MDSEPERKACLCKAGLMNEAVLNLNNKGRLTELDFIKGIMILLVVIGHSRIGLLYEGIYANTIDVIYLFHMPIFLLISGYVYIPRRGLLKEVYNITRTLLVPYLLFSIIYIFLLQLFKYLGYQTSNQLRDNSFLYQLFISPSAIWYLHNLALFRLMLLVCIYLGGRIHLPINVLLLFLSYFLYLSPLGYRIESLVFLIIGYNMRANGLWVGKFLSPIILIIPAIFLSAHDNTKVLGQIIISISIISFLSKIVFLYQHTIYMRFFDYLGRNSLIIYIIHVYSLYLCKLCAPLIEKVDPTFTFYIILVISFSVVVSLLTSKFLDIFHLSLIIFGKKIIYSPFISKA